MLSGSAEQCAQAGCFYDEKGRTPEILTGLSEQGAQCIMLSYLVVEICSFPLQFLCLSCLRMAETRGK